VSSLKCLILITGLFFAKASWAGGAQLHFADKQLDLALHDLQHLQEIIAVSPGAKFIITANKYDMKSESIRGMPRKYSLLRALKIRKFMIQKGVQLDHIQVMVTTDVSKENDLVIVDVK